MYNEFYEAINGDAMSFTFDVDDRENKLTNVSLSNPVVDLENGTVTFALDEDECGNRVVTE